MSSGQNMFTKGQTSELAWVTSSNIPSPLYLFSKILPLVYNATFASLCRTFSFGHLYETNSEGSILWVLFQRG